MLGNGCSATQFVPVMAETAGSVTQFARQAHYLAERPNPVYGSTFKSVMRYAPLAMRLYRFKLYADMEKDFAGFDIESGRGIRQGLKEENEKYVKKMAPERYWDALIPKHEIGCKRKVMDTDYLACLHRENVELVHDDPVEKITETGVLTKSGRQVEADAIIMATGFEVFRMLYPMEIIGQEGITLNEYWDKQHGGAAQAYFGTSISGFKNFFVMMGKAHQDLQQTHNDELSSLTPISIILGPNTVTGHLSVIYTVECQINYVLRLIEPILHSGTQTNGLLSSPDTPITSVNVKPSAAVQDSQWMQARLKKLVWASGCTSWALDPKTNLNIAMYPQYQFLFWLRSVFIPSGDFEYQAGAEGKVNSKVRIVVGGWKTLGRVFKTMLFCSVLVVGVRRLGGMNEMLRLSRRSFNSVVSEGRRLLGA